MNEKIFLSPVGYHLNSSIYSNISVPAGTWWASVNTSEVKCDFFQSILASFGIQCLFIIMGFAKMPFWQVKGYRYSRFSHPSGVQSIKYPGQSRKTRAASSKGPTTSLRLSNHEGQSWQKLMVFSFIILYIFWRLSMKAIVSKSSTCQERNCPLYLVATFTVEVHSDSCFLIPGEEYISILRWS